MTIDSNAILNAVVSHAAASGFFEQVNRHEPPHPQAVGLTAAVWVDRLGPIPAASGLNATSSRLSVFERIFTSMLQDPPDAIDPQVLDATDYLMGAYSGDFTLGGEIRNVDLLGAHGIPLQAQAGYVPSPAGGPLQRVMTITIPLIISDTWTQAE